MLTDPGKVIDAGHDLTHDEVYRLAKKVEKWDASPANPNDSYSGSLPDSMTVRMRSYFGPGPEPQRCVEIAIERYLSSGSLERVCLGQVNTSDARFTTLYDGIKVEHTRRIEEKKAEIKEEGLELARRMISQQSLAL